MNVSRVTYAGGNRGQIETYSHESCAMADIPVELEGWTAFHTPNLSIEPSLVGARHRFSFEGCTVTVGLPNAPRPDLDDQETISFSSWREVDGKKVPLMYSIGEVQVTVSIAGSHSLPSEMLDRPPNAFDLLVESRQRGLNALAMEHYLIAERAFDRWARTLRWKTGQWEILRDRAPGLATGWGTTLRHATTAKRLWVHHDTIVVHLKRAVTQDQWKLVQASLQAGEESAVFVDLLLDAEMHFAASDLRRAIIDAAVAAETYIRSTVQQTLPTGLGECARELVDEANVRPVMTKVFPESLKQLGAPSVDKGTMSDVHKLLDARNKLLHTGLVLGVDSARCEKYVRAVRTLLAGRLGG